VAADNLASVMMGDPPLIVFADEQVACGKRAAGELFLAQNQSDIAIQENLFVEASDPRGVRVG
jgi:hypothetical protein